MDWNIINQIMSKCINTNNIGSQNIYQNYADHIVYKFKSKIHKLPTLPLLKWKVVPEIYWNQLDYPYTTKFVLSIEISQNIKYFIE